MSVVVDGVTKYYGDQCILNNISFTLKEGEIVGFIGANGAGKTTTMDIITGYRNKWEGNVSIYKHDIKKYPLCAKKLIGYLPEHNPLEYKLFVREYLDYVASIYLPKSFRKKAINTVIEQVGLSNEQHKKIGMLSKGYKQRVGLAQALIHQPKVLILDEPTTGLDPEQLEEIRSLIKTISSDKTVLLSTHIMQEAEAICNRILILKKGNITQDFSLDSALGNNSTQRVRIAFSKAINLPSIPFAYKVDSITDSEYIVHGNKDINICLKLFELAKQQNLPLVHLSKEHDDFSGKIKKYLST